jgi:D-alanyl-D-alanine-carboxypeptidase/D-alanyl-D-alanine-endopeptidase
MSLAGVKTVFVLTVSAIAFTAVGSTAKAGAFASPPQQTKAAETVRSAVEPAAHAFVAEPRAAGLSIGVLRGDETFTGHFGNLERGKESPPDDRTIYPIASITKTFTGTLLAEAAVEKKVRLDADIREYLAGSFPGLEFQGHPILLYQLVNHRSGLPFVLPDVPPERANEVLRGQTKAAFLEHLRHVTLDAVPGTAFRYSNAGAQLAGYILEGIYGASYEELLRRRITGPLGMADTVITLSRAQRARLAKGYDGEGRLAPEVPDELQGAGALKSTIADMLRYARWHLAERDPAVVLTHQATLSEGNYSAGLNWQMLRGGGRRLIWQEGHVPGFLSYCVVIPELDLGLVLLANAEDRTSSARAASMVNQMLSALDSRAPSLP